MEMSCEMVLNPCFFQNTWHMLPLLYSTTLLLGSKMEAGWFKHHSSMTNPVWLCIFYCQSNAHKEIIAQFIVIQFLHYMLIWLLGNSPSPASPSLKTGTVFAFLSSCGISSLLLELSWTITQESDCSGQCLKCSRGNFIHSCWLEFA